MLATVTLHDLLYVLVVLAIIGAIVWIFGRVRG